MEIVSAINLRQRHVGSHVEAKAAVNSEPNFPVNGVIRWYTVTSDTVVVAVEEVDAQGDGDGATEWSFRNDDVLTLR